MDYKQTRFTLGISLFISALSSVFLAICYLFSDKKRTATPFTVLALIEIIGGFVLLSETIKEYRDKGGIQKTVEGLCAENEKTFCDVPTDEFADETEFS